MRRERLSATVRADVLKAGRRAVAEGRAESLSAWVSDALARQAEHDDRVKAMTEAIRQYESEFGVITDEDISAATRRTRARAIPVRPRPAGPRQPATRRVRGPA